MGGKRGLFVLVVLAAATVLTASAGASNRGSARIDLSTRGGVALYLTSLGIDSHGVVVQRGSHNYAGPNCPGKGWTCTTAKRVLQIASAHTDSNQFVCSGGFASPPDDCEIFQFSTSGDNVARCVEQSGDQSPEQSCAITQNNTSGANRATIQQQINTNDGYTQNASQYGGIRQGNDTGSNTAQINQDLKLSVKNTDLGGNQTQDGHQAASVTQDSDTTGNNSADVHQSLSLKADAKGGPTINQLQNTDGDVTSNVGIDQESGSGRNSAHVDQSNDYDAHVGKADTALQVQGSSGSGENVNLNQSSTGVSTIDSHQHEHQDLHADHVTNLTQNQYGPQWADPSQVSNPKNSYNLDQDSNQHASSPDTQDDQQYAECNTSGNCTVSEKIHQQNANQNNSCSGMNCDVNNVFTDGEGTSCSASMDEGSCSSEVTPDPPPTPPGD